MMRKNYTYIFLIAFLLCNASLEAQKLQQKQIQALTKKHLNDGILELKEILSIPNNASYPAHVQANVKWCEQAFGKRDFQTRLLETDGPPLLLASQFISQKLPTVLIYLQIDGQPVDSSRWFQPSPYEPVLKTADASGGWKIIDWSSLENDYKPDWRIFARSASDAKGPVIMFLKAMDILAEQNVKPSFNLKVIMDFEEELGSPHLPGAVKTYAEELMADHMIVLDGPRHPSNEPTLTFGARGIQTVTLKIFGPKNPQHSGHYGNYVPNPAFRMAHLLASMKDEYGRVTIPGYYKGISLDEKTIALLKTVPDDEAAIKKMIGISGQDSVADFLQASRQYPSLNIRGLQSGWVEEEVRTIVPDFAIAEIDIRLVKESDPEYLLNLLRAHIAAQGYHFVVGEPADAERQDYDKLISMEHEYSYGAFRTEINSLTGNWLSAALERAFGSTPIRIRTSGGSIPISPFVITLGVPAVTVPTVNSDNNQHSPNENLRLGNFEEGIRTVTAILTQPIE
ncbi:acetylornithine deacetylase/succinyl-diaminopimelate desuccinylase-like protein [Catalinimonas alkaloidigena]|uniref:M20/M25/M40 family metallo-hydrolase n=1 Tax=Catalinimonas alkaloidigena TaxID=1075417 RepID=UPI002405C8D4|nr:M20/M25/M40 family metallo-hydrolase [Catalinimonas alkaloidigena]MDF9798193.1 acetylornithine deacetylase/succinyl-diaminopimelate desuccinylase-like protein [Catalinimonas alkaloidigena]